MKNYEPREFEPDGGWSRYYRRKEIKSRIVQALAFLVIYVSTCLFIYYV